MLGVDTDPRGQGRLPPEFEAPLVAATNVALIVFALVVLRAAWMSDDSYVTLRTVDNLVRGHGATWNAGHRVQAYTHPLWMLVLTALYAVTREAFVAPMLLSAALSVGAVWIVAKKIAGPPQYGLLCVLAVLMSRTFVDYSTSGLENPLTHLLLAVFVLLYLRYFDEGASPKGLRRLVFVGALIGTNRLDLLALVGPAVLMAAWPLRWTTALREGLIGSTPLLAWEAFSLVYYGSLVPNTAYAKLGHGVAAEQVWRQGGVYLVHQLSFDPLSLLALVVGIGLGVGLLRAHPKLGVPCLGALLYVIYVCKVGGDFMAGRFFSAPFFLMVCLLPHLHRARQRETVMASAMSPFRDLVLGGVVITGVGFMADTPGPSLGDLDEGLSTNGVVDERQFWGIENHLIGLRSEKEGPYHGAVKSGRKARRKARRDGDHVTSRSAVGMYGMSVGPEVFIVDPYALGDGFLARLPASEIHKWRPGHAMRHVPVGYLETVETGEVHLLDPDLRELHRQVQLLETGPLFTRARWRAIFAANTGGLEKLIDREFYARPYHDELPAWTMERDVSPGAKWNDPGTVLVHPKRGLWIHFDEIHHESKMRVTADHNDRYVARFYLGDELLGQVEIGRTAGSRGGQRQRTVHVPTAARTSGFDRILFERDGGDRKLALGAVSFEG